MSQRQISTTKSPFHLEGEGVWGWKLVFTPADVTNPVEQLTDYYPFGMAHQYTRPNNDNKYLYNQKELQDDVLSNTGLNWYDYGARFYDVYNPDQIVPVIPEQSVPVIPDQSVPVIPEQIVPL